MEIHQLRYVVAAAEAGSITRAAGRCGVAQPSLSQQIAKLERELGTALFDRVGRGVVPTDAGRALLPRARRILAEVRELAEGVHADVDAGRGAIRVGAIPTIAPFLLPGVVESLRGSCPDASIGVREGLTEHLLEALAENEIDIALVSRPADHELVELETAGVEPLVAVVPAGHALAAAGSVGVGSLRAEPAVALDQTHCLGRQIEGFCDAKKIRRRVVCESTQIATVLEFVRAGAGVAILPEMAARLGPADRAVAVPLSQRDARREIVLARRVGRERSLLAERFADAVRTRLTRPS